MRTMVVNGKRLKVADHPWALNHWQEQARGCKNRRADKAKLHKMPWLRGVCQSCKNFKGEKHIHLDSGLTNIAMHSLCLNEKRNNSQH